MSEEKPVYGPSPLLGLYRRWQALKELRRMMGPPKAPSASEREKRAKQ